MVQGVMVFGDKLQHLKCQLLILLSIIYFKYQSSSVSWTSSYQKSSRQYNFCEGKCTYRFIISQHLSFLNDEEEQDVLTLVRVVLSSQFLQGENSARHSSQRHFHIEPIAFKTYYNQGIKMTISEHLPCPSHHPRLCTCVISFTPYHSLARCYYYVYT